MLRVEGFVRIPLDDQPFEKRYIEIVALALFNLEDSLSVEMGLGAKDTHR